MVQYDGMLLQIGLSRYLGRPPDGQLVRLQRYRASRTSRA